MRVTEMEKMQELEITELLRRVDRQFTEITSLRRTLSRCMGDLAQANAVVALAQTKTVIVRLPFLGKIS